MASNQCIKVSLIVFEALAIFGGIIVTVIGIIFMTLPNDAGHNSDAIQIDFNTGQYFSIIIISFKTYIQFGDIHVKIGFVINVSYTFLCKCLKINETN